ncbi:hypothetical protein ACHABX_13670, partial [Nesterenkonia halotolerans]
WAAMIPLFILVTARNLSYGVLPIPPALRHVAAEWAWTVVAVLYVATAGSVFLRFFPVLTGA